MKQGDPFHGKTDGETSSAPDPGGFEVGFLIGPAFAIFYTIAGLPLGWLADRVSRVLLIVVGQAFWSLASVSFGWERAAERFEAAYGRALVFKSRAR